MLTIRAYSRTGAQVFFAKIEKGQVNGAIDAMIERDDVRSVKITKGR